MSYTPDVTNTSQPTGNVQLSTAAAEFRAIKQRIIDVVTAQDARDDAQDTATALVASNLATALSAQNSRDDAQDSLISAVQLTADAALANAAAAQGTADAGVAFAVTAQITANAGLATRFAALLGAGGWTVPEGVTSLLVILEGGSTAQGFFRSHANGVNFNFISQSQAGQVKFVAMAVTPGDVIPYGTGVGQTLEASGSPATISETVTASDTFFGNSYARAGITRYYYDSGTYVQLDATSLISGYVWADTTRGSFPALTTSGVVTTSEMYSGSSGAITVFY